MIKIGFCFIKGGTGKTTLASSAVLYLNAAVAAAGLIDTAPVPVASLLLAAGTQPGVYAGREDVPVAVTRTPEALDAAIRALEKMKVSIAVVDLPPMAKTPRLDVAVVVADGPGLEFLPEFKADAAHVVLAANMVDKLDGRYKNLANSAVALPYSSAVAKAYAKLTPPILPHHPKAASLGRWKKAFLQLMNKVAEHVKK
jgi:cellulose biosynthesis protein BcsQ